MSIYSKNRFSSLGSSTMGVNPTYYNKPIARIMEEATINDSNLFASMYYNDYNEMASMGGSYSAIHEDFSAVKEKISSGFKKVKDGVIAFFKKLMAFIDSVITRIAGFLGMDISKKLKAYEDQIKNHSTAIEKIKLKKFRSSIAGAQLDLTEFSETAINAMRKDNKDTFDSTNDKDAYFTALGTTQANVISNALKGGNTKALKGNNEITVKSLKEYFFEEAKDTTVGEAVFGGFSGAKGLNGLIKSIADEKSNISIKDLKTKKNDIKKALDKILSEIGKKEKKNEAGDITGLRIIITTTQSTISKVISAYTGVRRSEISRNSAVLSRAITMAASFGEDKHKNKAKTKTEPVLSAAMDFAAQLAFSEAVTELSDENEVTPDQVADVVGSDDFTDDTSYDDSVEVSSEAYYF